MPYNILLYRLALGIFIIVSLVGLEIKVDAAVLPDSTPTISAAEIIYLTNTARAEAGLTPLATSTLLMTSAQMKANDMLSNQYFSHFGINGSGLSQLISKVGYQYMHAGENLALGQNNSTLVVLSWLNSPTHKANILNPKFTEIGIGLAYGNYQGYGQWFIVQHLGSTVY